MVAEGRGWGSRKEVTEIVTSDVVGVLSQHKPHALIPPRSLHN